MTKKPQEEILKLGIKTITDNQINVTIGMYEPKNTQKRVWPGDFVEVKVNRPNNYNSIFYKLAALNIYLSDYDNNNFYRFNDIFYNDNKNKENSLLNICINEIKKSSVLLKDNYTKEFINDGRFKNKSIYDAIQLSTTGDLLHFLEYISENPRKYSGQKNMIFNIYVEWLRKSTPLAPSTLYEKLLYFKVQSDIDSAISLSDIENHKNILAEWNKKSVELFNKYDFMASSSFLNMSLLLSKNINQHKYIADAYYISGKFKSNQQNFNDAITEYQNAYIHYKKTNHAIAMMASLNNACWQYIEMKEYKTASKEFAKAIKIQKKYISQNDDMKMLLNRIYALTINNYAWSMHLSNKSKKSVKYFNRAILILDDDKSEIAIKRLALINNNLSKVYEKLGNNMLFDEYRNKTKGFIIPNTGEVEDYFIY